MHFRPLPYNEIFSRKVRLHRFNSAGHREYADDDVDEMLYETWRVGGVGEILSGSAAFQLSFGLRRSVDRDDQLGVDVYDEEEAERNIVYDDAEDFQMFIETSELDHNIAQNLCKTESLPRVFRQYVNNFVVAVGNEDNIMSVGSNLRSKAMVVAKKNMKPSANSPVSNRIISTTGRFHAKRKHVTTASAKTKILQEEARMPKCTQTSARLERKRSIEQKQRKQMEFIQRHQIPDLEKLRQPSNVIDMQDLKEVQAIQYQQPQCLQLAAQQMQQHLQLVDDYMTRIQMERHEEFLRQEQEGQQQQQQEQEKLVQQQRALVLNESPAKAQEQKLKMLERVRRSKWRLVRKRLNQLKRSDMDNKIANPAKLSFLERRLESETKQGKESEATSPSTSESSSSVISVLSEATTSQVIKNESTFMEYVHQLQQFKLEHGHWYVVALRCRSNPSRIMCTDLLFVLCIFLFLQQRPV
jgi:hypothetical protein